MGLRLQLLHPVERLFQDLRWWHKDTQMPSAPAAADALRAALRQHHPPAAHRRAHAHYLHWIAFGVVQHSSLPDAEANAEADTTTDATTDAADATADATADARAANARAADARADATARRRRLVRVGHLHPELRQRHADAHVHQPGS